MYGKLKKVDPTSPLSEKVITKVKTDGFVLPTITQIADRVHFLVKFFRSISKHPEQQLTSTHDPETPIQISNLTVSSF